MDKVTTVADAVRRFVEDGEYLCVGGFGCDRIPTAAVHEIVRQKKQNLRFAGHTSTHDFQILGHGQPERPRQDSGKPSILPTSSGWRYAGCRRTVACHGVGRGRIRRVEHYALAVRLKAAAMGLPFLPTRSMLGTDTFRHSAAREIACPFTGQRLAAVPALYPDVAVIHVPEADCYGNCRIRGTNRGRPGPRPRGPQGRDHLRASDPERPRSAAIRARR